MLDATQDRLETLVRETCGEVPVVFAPPAQGKSTLQISFLLIGLTPNLAVRNDSRQPLQIYRRYLVCAVAPDSAQQASMLESLMFRALDGSMLQIENEPPSNDLWLALGLPPQAAFIMQVPVLHERTLQKAPPVQSVQLNLSPTGTLQGVLLDAAGMPIANCLVEIPSEQFRTFTDVEGHFKFQSLSREAQHHVRVVWKGKEFLTQPAVGSGFSEPLTLKLDLKTTDSRIKEV